MITFRPLSQATAFETRQMMRPMSHPPTRHAVPTLWERAKAMFAVTLTRAGSAMRLAFRRASTPQQRRDLILHLELVEKIVRVLMLIEAIGLPVMTPTGLKLRQITVPCRIPAPPPQVRTHKPHPEASRFRAAMMTIAAHQKRVDPRIAERRAREADQKRAAALDLQRQRFEDDDPGALTGQFNGIHWSNDPAARTAPSSRPRSLVLDDLIRSTFSTQARATIDPPDEDAEDLGHLTGPMLPLARRIASIPREHFSAPRPRRLRAMRRAKGCPEFDNACIPRLHPRPASSPDQPSPRSTAPMACRMIRDRHTPAPTTGPAATAGPRGHAQGPPPSESKTSPSCELA